MVFSLWTPYPKADKTSVTRKKCGNLLSTAEQRLSMWLHEKQLLKTWLLRMICTFLSVVCSFLCLLQAEWPRLHCRAVCFHLAVTSATVNTLHHTFYAEKQEHAMQVYSKVSFPVDGDYIQQRLHRDRERRNGYEDMLSGSQEMLTSCIFPVVSQILGVRKEYRTLGFFKKSCTSLLLERLNICDR